MAEEFRIRAIRPEIKEKLNTLFSELMDAHLVYQEINKKGYDVGYPEVVEHLQYHPFAGMLPLEDPTEKPKKRKKENNNPVKQPPILLPPKKMKKVFLLPEKKPLIIENQEPNVSNNKSIRDELYFAFSKILEYKTKEQGWVYEQAARFDALTKRKYNFDRITGVLQSYQKRQNQGIPFSTIEIAIETITVERLVKQILGKLDLIPKINITIDDKLETAIKNTLNIPEINIKEAAYFLKIPLVALKKYIKEKNLIFPKKMVYHNFIETSGIYEAQDAGFSLKEISEYVRANQRNTEHAIKRRGYLEPKIIEVLRQIYPEKEIKKPYI